ncbi:nickel pincer cofactor biosynthesis protein LarB [Actinoplanes sp. LDG1-06]|uniref:Nickel pincer cofactor biosynthesis protein LarB n=1 Tax=Paractinoplanes ovalisporus TaxID=2810368 RepID=A0ABS2A3A1_9ACTN|nr:nickel pincer cofactor biosynthesis protein LarB [Actinoplanes ovalisporus]MBM2614321.1 nickel pincer cofactor biosynthesis protein LarB [Actinoplanes ovalisporus]
MSGDLTSYAELDLDRTRRRGYPEAVYCAGKTPEQVAGIATALRDRAEGVTLFTRAGAEHAEAVLATLPDAFHDPVAGLLAWPPEPPEPTGDRVVVVAAGTSDLPVAREATLTAQYLGRATDLIVDVGVAGLHRILGHVDLLRRARAVVVVAGMDGALPGVVAGLIPAPVVAVPTSVGYGAAFEGLAALLTMLNACAPGVAVVNIDNGYGAGHLAAQITAPPGPAAPITALPGRAAPTTAPPGTAAPTTAPPSAASIPVADPSLSTAIAGRVDPGRP